MFSFFIKEGDREETRPMEINIGIKVRLIKFIEGHSKVLQDMRMAITLAHHGGIFSFSQGIVVAYTDVGKGREQERKLWFCVSGIW